jgi:hypothetical protein
MGFSGTQPNDAAQVPLSSEYSPQNNTFPAMQGADGAYVDAYGNASTAPVMSFIQPRIVQRATATTGVGAITLSCSFQNPVMGGNSIILCLGTGIAEGAGVSLVATDTQGNTYTKAVKSPQGSKLQSTIFFATNIKSGQATSTQAAVLNTITIIITGPTAVPTGMAMKIYEVWGLVASVDALDQIAVGSDGVQTASTSAIAPLVPNTLIFSALSTTNVVTITPASGWSTNDGTLFPWGGNLGAFNSDNRRVPTIASLIPTASLALPSLWAMAVASFKSIVVPVSGTFNQARASNAIMTSIISSLTPVQLLAANAARLGVNIFNTASPSSQSAATLFIAYGPVQGKTAYVTQVPPGALWEMPQPIVPSPIYGWWSALGGTANITELS